MRLMRLMKWRLALLILAASAVAHAQYVWDYSGIGPYTGYANGWVVNGDATFAAASGGSALWPTTVTGVNPNDYEINTTLLLKAAGGTYMHFLRANSTSVLPGTGSYISVEYAVPSNWQSGATVPVAINQCISGTVTQLGSASVPLHDGDTIRSIVWGTTLWIFRGQHTVRHLHNSSDYRAARLWRPQYPDRWQRLCQPI